MAGGDLLVFRVLFCFALDVCSILETYISCIMSTKVQYNLLNITSGLRPWCFCSLVISALEELAFCTVLAWCGLYC